MTRRSFLSLIGMTSGAAAVHSALGAMGLMQATQPSGGRHSLANSGSSRGKRILILGAGLAGLGAGYELSKAGYDCRVLEARLRPGGRCVTIRRGSNETEIDGRQQTAQFDDGIYFNPGPTRIPQHHLTLDYCRELGVAVELFGNVNDAAYRYVGGKRTRVGAGQGRLASEAAYVSELLAKVARQDRLDEPLTVQEREALRELLRQRATAGPAGGFGGDPDTRQLVMFQISGGVDRLATAFADRLGSDIEYGAKVTEIRQRDDAVVVHYTDRLGRPQETRADLCICTIPPSVLRHVDADLSNEMKRAIASIEMSGAAKIGLQFRRRFWEEDDRIFGGITQTDQSITQIMYPSYGWLGRKGLLIGCYAYGSHAREIGKLNYEQRIERAIEEGEKIHPQYRAEFEAGFSMVWERVPYSLGAWSGDGNMKRLREPDGRIYLAGEHTGGMGGWMAGALHSARMVGEAVHARVQNE